MNRSVGVRESSTSDSSQVPPRSVERANTSFQVPIADTNNYVLDSALLALSRAVSSQPTAEHRGRLAHAIETLEQYYQSVANPSSLKALREAAAVALEVYRRTNAPTSNDAV